ncbi:N-acetylmuramoyl-L-alanine amidase [Kitasatospora sp. A2-31]|uniref:N-acetylmuramoyl-L-alanine amidase n=1 Tax=Kitasatospora sp. A2-31 TaxID=2916414 RepID=UPI0035ABACFC
MRAGQSSAGAARGPPVRPRTRGRPPGRRAPAAPRTLPAESSPARRADHEAPRPGIVTRAGWGADESLRDPGFVYTGQVRAVFVHHTATATDYSCSDAPQMIRAIYQYHVQSNGWRDIGYNFLVDRCGTIYEGRAGGVDQPVFGAHTLAVPGAVETDHLPVLGERTGEGRAVLQVPAVQRPVVERPHRALVRGGQLRQPRIVHIPIVDEGGGAGQRRRGSDGAVWRASRTPAGVGTLRVLPRPAEGTVEASAWGPGAQWLLDRLPALLGAQDDPAGLVLPPGPLRDAQRRSAGIRLTSTGLVLESLVPAILEQKVTTLEAYRAWRTLLRGFGTPAPGPAQGMWVAPSARDWALVPSWEWHRAGVDPKRSATVVRAVRLPPLPAAAVHRQPRPPLRPAPRPQRPPGAVSRAARAGPDPAATAPRRRRPRCARGRTWWRRPRRSRSPHR